MTVGDKAHEILCEATFKRASQTMGFVFLSHEEVTALECEYRRLKRIEDAANGIADHLINKGNVGQDKILSLVVQMNRVSDGTTRRDIHRQITQRRMKSGR